MGAPGFASALRRLGGEALAFLDRLLDGADHVEGSLRQVVVLAIAQTLEAADGIGEVDELAGRAGEHFGHVQRLRQEALDLARASNRKLVCSQKLVNLEDGDDIVGGLVASGY